MSVAAAAKVFSIPPAENFLDCFADALLGGKLIPGFPPPGDPLALARATIFMPNRRSCRALEANLARRGLVLMPRLRPLGDIDESDLLFSADTPDMLDLPPAISPLERQLILTQLIMAWADAQKKNGHTISTPASPADAAWLATALGRMLDMVANEGLAFEAILDLPPLELQAHREAALNFLKIASTIWPDFLQRKNLEEPNIRRRRLLQLEAAQFAQHENTPVIAAGSTASVPVTAEFLAAIACHPSGCVVLPGLDRVLDEDAFQSIATENTASHPQIAMARFLKRIGLARDEVTQLGASTSGLPRVPPREQALSQALRPADTTDAWALSASKAFSITEAVDGIGYVEAASAHEEALTIACLMRDTLQHETQTAALITPDRILARRVAAELKRFGVSTDDSAGTPLLETQAGLFARLICRAAQKNATSADILSLLKHPLCLLNNTSEETESLNGVIDRICFRGLQKKGLLTELPKCFDTAPITQAAENIDEAQRCQARARLTAFSAAMTHFQKCFYHNAPQPLAHLLSCHRSAMEALAGTMPEKTAAALRGAQGGQALAETLDLLQSEHTQGIALDGEDYLSFLEALISPVAVRAPLQNYRAFIYGLPEARLIRHDRVILGGMNEGIWPASAQNDPWLSRGMRANLDLPVPEMRIGLAAHDFAQAMGTKDIFITRSKKVAGAPSVPSRFVQRLAAFVGDEAFAGVRARGDEALQLARHLTTLGEAPQPCARPAPVPPQKLRLRQLSVTQVENLLRDPYAIYAQKILKLRAFEQMDESFGGKERGLLIHDILARFASAVNDGAPLTQTVLEQIAHDAYAPFFENAEVQTYWWPRFQKLIPELVDFERQRRSVRREVAVERNGVLPIKLENGDFKLTARADRIESDGKTLAIIDYKTGTLPAQKEITASFALQTNLQAAMANHGAFENISGTVTEAFYVGFAQDELDLLPKNEDKRMPEAERALAGVITVLRQFDAGAPFLSKADSGQAPKYNDYLHLARVKEWGFAVDSEEAAE